MPTNSNRNQQCPHRHRMFTKQGLTHHLTSRPLYCISYQKGELGDGGVPEGEHQSYQLGEQSNPPPLLDTQGHFLPTRNQGDEAEDVEDSLSSSQKNEDRSLNININLSSSLSSSEGRLHSPNEGICGEILEKTSGAEDSSVSEDEEEDEEELDMFPYEEDDDWQFTTSDTQPQLPPPTQEIEYQHQGNMPPPPSPEHNAAEDETEEENNINHPLEPGRKIRFRQLHNISQEDLLLLELVDILDSVNAPHYLFKTILDWTTQACQKSKTLREGGKLTCSDKASFLKSIVEKTGIDLPPMSVVPVVLENESSTRHEMRLRRENLKVLKDNQGRLTTEQELDMYRRDEREIVEVIMYENIPQLQDICDMSLWEDRENLVLNENPKDWWRPYKPKPGEHVDEILSGDWYQRTVKQVGLDKINSYEEWVKAEKPMVMPLVGYLDEIKLDKLSRKGAEPFLVTFANIRRRIRNGTSGACWRQMCYLPDVKVLYKGERNRNSKNKKGEKEKEPEAAIHHRNYLKCLAAGLKGIREVHEQTGCVKLRVTIGDETHVVTAYIPISIVIGDNKSQDYLCGLIHSSKIKDGVLATRGCKTPMCNAAETGFLCQFITDKEVIRLHRSATQMAKPLFLKDRLY